LNDLLIKLLAPLIIVLVTIQLSFGICAVYGTEQALTSKKYVINGEYLGYITFEANGKYAEKYLSKNNTLKDYIKLNIFYFIEVNITLYQNSIYYEVSYKLTDFNIKADNIDENITKEIKEKLVNEINKTVHEYTDRVDPSILLNISNNEIIFQKIYFLPQNITGITIFDDVYCYEIRSAIKIEEENTTYTDIISQYREVLTYTPLYFYRTIYVGSLFPKTDYYKLKILIINYNIGEQLSNIILTNSTIFYMNNDMSMGKIGFIALNMSSTNISSKIRVENNKIIYTVNSYAPYRIMMLLNENYNITHSNIKLQEFNSTSLKLYLSPIMMNPYKFIIKLSEKPLLLNNSNNEIGLHGITLEERDKPSLADIILTVITDITIIGFITSLVKIINDKF